MVAGRLLAAALPPPAARLAERLFGRRFSALAARTGNQLLDGVTKASPAACLAPALRVVDLKASGFVESRGDPWFLTAGRL
jgi:hypothetical protein